MPPCRPAKPPSCRPKPPGKKASLDALIAEFRTKHLKGIERELEFFRTRPSIEVAIRHAATATDEDGYCFDHQFRILRAARLQAAAILTSAKSRFRACASFHELHTLLSDLLSPVPGLGELYVYDTALRLGTYVGLAPDFVYLHAGTREGARALGLGRGRAYLELHDLPGPLRALSVDEVESFFCFYKALL